MRLGMAPRSLLGTWLGITTSLAPSLQACKEAGDRPSQPEPGICTVLLCPADLHGGTLSCFGSGSRVRPRWPHGAYHCTGPLALLCFPVYPLLGQPLPSASLNCVSSSPRWIMPVVYGRRRVSGFIIYMDMCAHTRCCSCMPAPTFTTAKGQAFLTVPSFHQRSLSPCASRRTNSPTGLLGRLRLFMNRTPPISSPSAFPSHTHTPLLPLLARSPFFSSLCFLF